MIEQVIRILMAGGGTGGHVYPAIAIARAIEKIYPNSMIRFAGTKNRIEWKAVPAAGYQITPVAARGLQRGQPLKNLGIPFVVAKGLLQSWRAIQEFEPHVLVGTGGYVSAPVLWAGGVAKVPYILQEQNAFPGKTNRALSERALRIHIAFPEAAERLPAHKCELSGNPVRPELVSATREAGLRMLGISARMKVLLVFGGSGGSAALNQAMANAVGAILEDPGVHVVWQTGPRYFDEVQSKVQSKMPTHDRLTLLAYIDRMPSAYAAADLVLCRSGAITCSELEVSGTPAILVPSPNVAEDHQTWNARSLVADGAAVLLPEKELESKILGEVQRLLADADARAKMRTALLARARPDAADTIARDVIAIARGEA